MAMERIAQGRVERFYEDELVVALPHKDVVESELTELGASVTKADEDEGLDLARLTLEKESIGGAIRQLREDPNTEETLRRFDEEYRGEHNDSLPPDLDLLLRGLRERFERRFAHWTPVIGKNRLVDEGLPHLGGGGVGVPEKLLSTPEAFQGITDRQAAHGARVAILDTAIFSRSELAPSLFAAPGAVIEPAEVADGETMTAAIDEIGYFVVHPIPSGPFRLLCRGADGSNVVTDWILL